MFNPASGASGGTLLIWDSSVFVIEVKMVEENFSCAIGRWNGVEQQVGLVNVYAPQCNNLKRVLWESLLTLIQSRNIVWIIFGDFNVVRNSSERRGSRFNAQSASHFNAFIAAAGLNDFKMGSSRFTRFSKDGGKMSKLDRFLVTSIFFYHWMEASVMVMGRIISDHSPIALKHGPVDFGPKSFKVFNNW